MKTQIMKLVCDGEWKVIRDSEAKVNPYRIYHTYRELTDYGLVKHQKLIAKYANLYSCMCHISDYVSTHDRE